jgi:hypothetical protein
MEMPLYRELWLLRGTAFKEGPENVEDDHRSGRPILSTNDEHVEVVQYDGETTLIECQDDCRRNRLG